jgi:hypothetical protein
MAIYLGPSMKPKDAQKVREFDAELEKRYLDLLTNSANVYHLFEPNDPARPLLEELVLQDGRYPTLDEYLGKQRTDSTIRSVTNDLKQRVVAKFARQLDERANKHLQSEITGSLEHVGTDLTGSQAESLQKEAESLEASQRTLVASKPAEKRYDEALAQYVRAKSEQIDRLEDRLERLIETAEASLAAGASRWEAQRQRQMQRLDHLEERLERVQEIREESGLYATKVEELAEEKLRREEPELTRERDAALQRHRYEKVYERVLNNEAQRELGEELGRSVIEP